MNLKKELKIMFIMFVLCMLIGLIVGIGVNKILHPEEKSRVEQKFDSYEELELFIKNEINEKIDDQAIVKLEEKKELTLYRGWLDGGVAPYTVDGLYMYKYQIRNKNGIIIAHLTYTDPYYDKNGDYHNYQIKIDYEK